LLFLHFDVTFFSLFNLRTTIINIELFSTRSCYVIILGVKA
jgi:hypothetical protein